MDLVQLIIALKPQIADPYTVLLLARVRVLIGKIGIFHTSLQSGKKDIPANSLLEPGIFIQLLCAKSGMCLK